MCVREIQKIRRCDRERWREMRERKTNTKKLGKKERKTFERGKRCKREIHTKVREGETRERQKGKENVSMRKI
jgi:hypothetical protein